MSEPARWTPDTVEFTREWYRGFLDRLLSEGYRFRSFGSRVPASTALLRHDVDLSLEAAVEMARIEAERGVEATYFLLAGSPLYNPLEPAARKRIRELEGLGHDVGLHFSTHSYWPETRRPEDRELAAWVRAEQEVLDAVAGDPVNVVSFHVPPEWVLDRPIEGVASTYAPAVFSEIGYVADSSQRWRREPPLSEPLPDRVQVLVHPGLWGEEDASFEARVTEATERACRRVRELTRREFLGEGPG
jgi:peptidoglycan/xylan/chitin deacetylase (PgdA/CDA1 family)